ncbi:MAG: hypothetical protein ACE5R4_17070 [Armatimonadota bacterium]
MAGNLVMINRAPVLTLWASVVAERQGYDRDEALTLGKVLAGLNAQAKGRRLGIYGPPKGPQRGGPPKKVGLGEEFWVQVCGRPVPAKSTEQGVRAVIKDQAQDPDKVRKYLEGKFKDSLEAVREAMAELAAAFEPEDLEEVAFGLYEQFRPKIASGRRGWGQKGELDLDLIRSLAGGD